VKGDRVEILVDTGNEVRGFEIVATRAGRRVETTTGRGVVEVAEVTRTGRVTMERGEHVILVRPETSPDDVHGMIAAEGILTSRGGLVSHAAVVARGMGKPAVCGASALDIDLDAKRVSVDGTTVREGDVISIGETSLQFRREMKRE